MQFANCLSCLFSVKFKRHYKEIYMFPTFISYQLFFSHATKRVGMDTKNISRKSTDDLKTELKKYGELQDFLEQHEKDFIILDCGSAIQEYISKKNLTKSEAAKRSGMSTVYLYQLLSGKRHPSRDRIICICIGLALSMEESQELLKKSGCSGLYLKIRRDAIIIFGIQNGLSIHQINDRLYENGEKTLI